jgi:predicted RNA-binding protein
MITHEQIKHIVNSSRREREQPIEKLTVKSFEDALRIWNDPDVLDFYENKAMKWRPKHDIAVFIPCSAWKPYFYSQSHKDGYLKALLPYINAIDLFVVSEPMVIVPYCYSDEYPVKSYDYDPYKFFIGKLANPLAKQALNIFIERLSRWVNKYTSQYSKKILILPKSWHLKIFLKALKKANIEAKEYNIISMRGRAFQLVKTIHQRVEIYMKRRKLHQNTTKHTTLEIFI